MLGEEEIERISTHRQRLEPGFGSRTYSHDFKRLAAPNRVREADLGTALLVSAACRPHGSSCDPGTATAA